MSSAQILTDYATKFANGQIAELELMLDDNVQYWVQGFGTFGKTEVICIMRDIISKFERATTEMLDTIEMGNKAAITMRTTFILKSGKQVVDELCMFAETANGRLIKVREYLDQSVLKHFE